MVASSSLLGNAPALRPDPAVAPMAGCPSCRWVWQQGQLHRRELWCALCASGKHGPGHGSRGLLDQTRDISHFHTEVVLAVSYLWLCPRESAQQCALSGIRQSNQTDICDALQFQDDEGFGSWLPSTQAGYLLLSVCFGWSHLLHDKSIPQSTFPSLCYDQPLPRFCRFSNRILHILFLPLFVFLLIIDVELIFILPKLFILAFSLILFTYLLLTWIGSYIIISV